MFAVFFSFFCKFCHTLYIKYLCQHFIECDFIFFTEPKELLSKSSEKLNLYTKRRKTEHCICFVFVCICLSSEGKVCEILRNYFTVSWTQVGKLIKAACFFCLLDFGSMHLMNVSQSKTEPKNFKSDWENLNKTLNWKSLVTFFIAASVSCHMTLKTCKCRLCFLHHRLFCSHLYHRWM